jgi:hypothetical protein
MNEMTRFTLTIPMPRIASVQAMDNLMVRVTWSAGIRANRTDVVDLSPLINTLKFYRPLRKDRALFSTVHTIEEGTILAWGAGEIDMAADSVEELAEETMTADDFKDFLKSNNLTHNEAAALLGYSRRQIENYLSGREPIPRIVVMACFGLLCRKQRKNPRGFQTSAETHIATMDTSPRAPRLTSEPLIASLMIRPMIGHST